jgi:Fic family protein
MPDPIHVSPKKGKGGRLARRSPADIARALDAVVILVRKSTKGLRSEEIRKALKLDVREVPRVLKEGLSKKKLKSKGQKRATTYSVA